jgi:hypothetical protein
VSTQHCMCVNLQGFFDPSDGIRTRDLGVTGRYGAARLYADRVRDRGRGRTAASAAVIGAHEPNRVVGINSYCCCRSGERAPELLRAMLRRSGRRHKDPGNGAILAQVSERIAPRRSPVRARASSIEKPAGNGGFSFPESRLPTAKSDVWPVIWPEAGGGGHLLRVLVIREQALRPAAVLTSTSDEQALECVVSGGALNSGRNRQESAGFLLGLGPGHGGRMPVRRPPHTCPRTRPNLDERDEGGGACPGAKAHPVLRRGWANGLSRALVRPELGAAAGIPSTTSRPSCLMGAAAGTPERSSRISARLGPPMNHAIMRARDVFRCCQRMVVARGCRVAGPLVRARLTWRARSEALRDRGRLDPVRRVELPQDVRDVHAGGLHADHERLRDLAVRVTTGDQRKHLGLARSQPEDLPHALRAIVRLRVGRCRLEPSALGQQLELSQQRLGADSSRDRVRLMERRARFRAGGAGCDERLGLTPAAVPHQGWALEPPPRVCCLRPGFGPRDAARAGTRPRPAPASRGCSA